jgi:hypothetical protein
MQIPMFAQPLLQGSPKREHMRASRFVREPLCDLDAWQARDHAIRDTFRRITWSKGVRA